MVNFGQNYCHLQESRTAYIMTVCALVQAGRHDDARTLHNAIMEWLSSAKVTFMHDNQKCVLKDKKQPKDQVCGLLDLLCILYILLFPFAYPMITSFLYWLYAPISFLCLLYAHMPFLCLLYAHIPFVCLFCLLYAHTQPTCISKLIHYVKQCLAVLITSTVETCTTWFPAGGLHSTKSISGHVAIYRVQ